MTTAPDPHPFHTLLGIEVIEAANGHARVKLADRPDLLNVRGTLHGGAIASLIDVAIGLAARSTNGNVPMVTVSLTVNYLAAPVSAVRAEATVTRSGRTLASGEARIWDERGSLVAQGLATFRVQPA